MGQLTIYLDEETEKKLNALVKKSGLSKSRWIAELIREKAAQQWPNTVKELAGAWKDFPLAEELRRFQTSDTDREPL